jgi:hypothetical protein
MLILCDRHRRQLEEEEAERQQPALVGAGVAR